MAYSSVQVLAKLIEEKAPDLRLKNAVFLDYLSAQGQVKRGDHTDLYWNAIATGSTAVGVPMTTAGSSQATGDAVQATLGIGANKIYHQFDVSLVDLQNAKAAGVGKLKNLFMQNMKGGLIAIRRKMNTALWAGTGLAADGGIIGMQTVLDPTATYANINPTTYSQWVPIVTTAGAPRALTRPILQDYTRILEEQETYSDALFCTPLMGQTYSALFDNVAGINSVMTESAKVAMTDLGHLKRAYDGVPIITDPQMPNGQLVGIAPTDIEVLSMDLADADSGQIAALGLKNNLNSIASAEVGGMVVNVALLPQANPGIITFQMFVLPQLKVTNRRSVTGILNLS
jgi:hypothetical protein